MKVFRGHFGLALLLMVFLSMGCNSTKKATGGMDKEEATLDRLYREIGKRQIDVEWLDSRARVSFEDEYTRVQATAVIRMCKDSAIWASIRKFGFEVARVLIHPDSIYVMDRINNEYMTKPISAIKEYVDIPANFGILQNLLLGNLVVLGNRPELTKEASKYRLKVDEPEYKSEYYIDEDYHLERMDVLDVRSNTDVEIVFTDYKTYEDNKNFSYLRSLKIENQDQGLVQLGVSFSKVDFNIPKKLDFEIPKKYSKVD
ncbi:MAG: DUF4292 domain-containing protein [Bacteroidota bacterium]